MDQARADDRDFHRLRMRPWCRNSVPKTTARLLANPPRIVNNGNISDNWMAVVQKIYPTGEAGLLNGTIGQGKISFMTKHVPDFADEETTITVEGRFSSDEIQVFMQYKDGYSKGVAHRVAGISKAQGVDSLMIRRCPANEFF